MTATYQFDKETQTEIASCMMWDGDFLRRTADLVTPDYFEDQIEAGFVRASLTYFETYKDAPGITAWRELIKDGFAKKPQLWRDDQKTEVVTKFGESAKLKVRDRSFLLDKVAEFAAQQEMMNSLIYAAVEIGKSGDPDRFERVKKRLANALTIGLATEDKDYDYFERIEDRTKERLDIAAGGKIKTGVPTGIKELDDLLKHGGYGRKELTLWMGGAKSTKSFNLLQAAAVAVQNGYNCLFITLENSIEVQSDRLDAFFSDIGMSKHLSLIHNVEAGVKAVGAAPKTGILKMREYPMGTFRPMDLERLIEEYQTKGISFDIVVIDYVDIMASDHRFENKREESEEICRRVRAIGQHWGMAMVSAIQTNREGHKAATARAEHAAEDFNKIRIADLVISVNRTDEEKTESKARLYLAAGRNQRDGMTIFVKQDLDKGRAVAEVEMVE